MKPLNITSKGLSIEIRVSASLISGIINGKRRISTGTARRFAKFFGNSPQFWLNLQSRFDLELEKNV